MAGRVAASAQLPVMISLLVVVPLPLPTTPSSVHHPGLSGQIRLVLSRLVPNDYALNSELTQVLRLNL